MDVVSTQLVPHEEEILNEIFDDFSNPTADGCLGPCYTVTRENLLEYERKPICYKIIDDVDWALWKENCVQKPTKDSSPSFSLLMCPRQEIRDESGKLKRRSLALATLPVERRKFKDIAACLYVPSVFFEMIRICNRSGFTKLEGIVEDQECHAYIFVVDSSLEGFTAISITYFPASKQVYGLFMGYHDKYVRYMTTELCRNRHFTHNPFALISSFLDIERFYRFQQVSNTISRSDRKIHHSQLDSHDTNDQSKAFYDLHHELGEVTTQLKMWKLQLNRVLLSCPKLQYEWVSTRPRTGFLLRPEDFIMQLQEKYELQIMRCERSMQKLTLAFQRELAKGVRNKIPEEASTASNE
ncbi:hypothetical protein NW762_001173 [Fusarium torreyae]|uniref:Uncharacterized protein n=1 Tax=Fusarium torreyae TaxID=1237075 RepID=A0A9W8VLA5_9HYPO|nr:hypothetical protein NW762_001173 [Fusarium torreyae]